MTVEVRPFEAIVYNQDKVKPEEFIAPPYDVITPEEQNRLYENSLYNIVRIILSKNTSESRYEEIANTYHNWLDNSVLVQNEKPCILYLIQEFERNGKNYTRKGFIARCRIEDFSSGNIYPHEVTMSGPKADRLEIMKACKANFSQIFMVYSDKDKTIEKMAEKYSTPFIDVTDSLGVRNIVFKIEDEDFISGVYNTMKDKTLLIADGHHRYETAMNYRNFVNSPDENDKTKFVMSYFTNMEDDLMIFPTHRVITKKIDVNELLEKAGKYFDIETMPYDDSNKEEVKTAFLNYLEESNKDGIAFGLYTSTEKEFYVFKLGTDITSVFDEYDVPEALRELDLAVLHKTLLQKELGYSEEELLAQNGILYIRQESEAFDMIDRGEATASFIMAYPKIEDIHKVVKHGCRMPQKSTYFYPKLLSGVAINPLK